MTTFHSDTFTESTDTDLASHTGEVGASWTSHPDTTGIITDDGDVDRIYKSSGSVGIYYASGVPGTSFYDVVSVFYVTTYAGISTQLFGRLKTGTSHDGYSVRFNQVAGRWELIEAVATVWTIIGTYSQTLSAGVSYVVKLQIRDANKKVFIDGVERISVTDNAVTAKGRPGVAGAVNLAEAGGIHIDSQFAVDWMPRCISHLQRQGAL